MRAGTTAIEWHGLDEGDESPEPGEETAIRIVASAVEVLRSKSFADLSEEDASGGRRVDPRARGGAPGTADAPDARRGEGRAVRRPPHAAAVAPHAGGAVRSRVARPPRPRPAARADPRRERLDVPVRAGARAVRLRGDGRGPAGRGVLLRDAAHPRHADAPDEGSRTALCTRSAGRSPTGRAGRGSGSRSSRCWTAGASGRRCEERSSCCAATGWSAAIPELLRAQMARLGRLAHKVVWVNPLKGSPRYEPLARGMAAALPSVDVFLSGHNLESLSELSRTLAG